MFLRSFALNIFVAIALSHGQALPPVGEVIAKLMESDNHRREAFPGYTAMRQYTSVNSQHKKRAEMVIKVDWRVDGSKAFETVSAAGWGVIRDHVFPRLLEGEIEASQPHIQQRSRISPENYSFELDGTEDVNSRPAYRVKVTPKAKNKYLIQGKIWIDMDDFAIARIEGKPAKSPSFWIKSVQFVHIYRKNGRFWLPSSDRSVTDARFVGGIETTIEYFDYKPNSTVAFGR
jgi:hypothetical protein